ncbi:hypothetical protein C8D91_2658 [Marinicella litoralis]|uniref:Uncharacterized protein n=1 Tax=Marinicella litoralis TaxID=644220 RepID=A0A4R6XBY5_9GAMM|nr:hypothetical protein C8D91_2658 [Marinicella litoralis]
MKRPFSLYIIIIWFFLLFGTFIPRYKIPVIELIGLDYYKLSLFVIFFITLAISIKLYKCDKIYIWFAITFFGIFTTIVYSQYIWNLIIYWQNINTNHIGVILMIALTIYSFVYLLIPKNRKKLAEVRKHIEADEDRKFLLKQMNRNP